MKLVPSRGYTQTSPRPAKTSLAHRPMSPQNKIIKSPSPAASSSEDSDSDIPVKSRLLRRPPRFTDHRAEDADDDDDAPAFLPFSSTIEHDPSATLRLNDENEHRYPPKRIGGAQESQTSDSSASSAALVKVDKGKPLMGTLSPRRTAELSGRSPMSKGKGVGRDGSDGSPSMGSSFSDLDGKSLL